MKKTTHRFRNVALAFTCLLGLSGSVIAAPFSSGSTGADGAFAPTQNTVLVLPPSGVFNFTTVSIPTGVTVSFKSNAANTPVMILATGDVTIDGAMDIRGGDADRMREPVGAFLQQGALGGPGGYAGGRGGNAGGQAAAPGQGPGGGEGGNAGSCGYNSHARGGGGGGFAAVGMSSYCKRSYSNTDIKGAGGGTYGSSVMLPLVGGSGGGGGAGAVLSTGIPGAGGGGGGGALLIASSGKVTVAGTISAQGGNGGDYASGCGAWKENVSGAGGGGGSGGIVRILAQTYQGGGTINVSGGAGGCWGNNFWGGGSGSLGYVSVETPRAGTLSLNGLPSLAITQIGGQAVPVNPTGSGDISLPLTQANPVQVDIAARYIPPGTALKVVLTPSYSGDVVSVNASPLAGTLENSTASASINIPYGASTLLVQASYTLTLAMGEALSVYAQGERVESILMSAVPGGETEFKLVTVSGKQFAVAPTVLAMVMPS